jgi:hypothetical protein
LDPRALPFEIAEITFDPADIIASDKLLSPDMLIRLGGYLSA